MRSLREIAGNKRFEALAGRTMAENHEWWLDRVRRDANIGGANHVQLPWEMPERATPEPGDENASLRRHLDRAGAPSVLAEILVRKELRQSRSVQAIAQWWGRGTSFMLLHGESGGGKTCAAISAFLRMRRTIRWEGGALEEWDSVGCAFEPANELAHFGYFSEDAHELLKHLGKVTCLVLDDLGVEMMSESWTATLGALLAERAGRLGCRTILTTNLSAKRPKDDPNKPSPFEERYGARLARRIRESGSVVAVERES